MRNVKGDYQYKEEEEEEEGQEGFWCLTCLKE